MTTVQSFGKESSDKREIIDEVLDASELDLSTQEQMEIEGDIETDGVAVVSPQSNSLFDLIDDYDLLEDDPDDLSFEFSDNELEDMQREDADTNEDSDNNETSDDGYAEETSDESEYSTSRLELLSAFFRRDIGQKSAENNIFMIYNLNIIASAIEGLLENQFKIIHQQFDADEAPVNAVSIVYMEPEIKQNVVEYAIAYCRKGDKFVRRVGALIAACNYLCGYRIPIVLFERGQYSQQIKQIYSRMYL